MVSWNKSGRNFSEHPLKHRWMIFWRFGEGTTRGISREIFGGVIESMTEKISKVITKFEIMHFLASSSLICLP